MVLKSLSSADPISMGNDHCCDESTERRLPFVGGLISGIKAALLGGQEASPSADAIRGRDEEQAAPRRILVVDSQATSLLGLAQLLESCGHKVFTARTVPETVAVLESQPVDTLLIGYQLDNTDGASLLHLIREEKLSDAPAFFISADHSVHALRVMREAGAMMIFEKPVTSAVINRGLLTCDAGTIQPDPKSLRIQAKTSSDPRSLDEMALFDLSVVHRCKELSLIEPGFGELLSLSPQDWSELAGSISNMLVVGNVVRVRHYAHTLKGSASQLGALRLTELMRRIIDKKAALILSQRDDLVATVHAVTTQTVAELAAVLGRSAGATPVP